MADLLNVALQIKAAELEAEAAKIEPPAEIPVNEESFHNAVNNASVFARKRLFKKMEKVVFPRRASLAGTDKKGIHNFARQGRPPKDLEEYVTNFVRTHYKEAK